MAEPSAASRRKPAPKATATKVPRVADHELPEDPAPLPPLAALPELPMFGEPATQPRRKRPLRGTGPVYQQIANDLREQIESGDLAAGQPIPSESQMMQHYGVSRATIRNAIAALRTSGLVDVRHGRGTTVRGSTTAASEDTITFTAALNLVFDGHGVHFATWDASEDWTETEEPGHYRSYAAHFAHVLELPPTEPVFIRERQLIHTRGVEITHRVYLPLATITRIPKLETNPFLPPADLYQAFKDAGHGAALTWEDDIRAVMPSQEETRTLNLPDGVPVFVHVRVTFDAKHRPIMLEEARLPAHRVSIAHRVPDPT